VLDNASWHYVCSQLNGDMRLPHARFPAIALVVALIAAAGWGVACTVNPQPLPPGAEKSGGDDASAGTDSSQFSGDGNGGGNSEDGGRDAFVPGADTGTNPDGMVNGGDGGDGSSDGAQDAQADAGTDAPDEATTDALEDDGG
jgi:hypothetical protein